MGFTECFLHGAKEQLNVELLQWLKMAAKVENLEEFWQKIHSS